MSRSTLRFAAASCQYPRKDESDSEYHLYIQRIIITSIYILAKKKKNPAMVKKIIHYFMNVVHFFHANTMTV